MKFSLKLIARQNLISLLFFCVAILVSASWSVAQAQDRDPFRKPVVAVPKPKTAPAKSANAAPKPKPAGPTAVAVPPIQARIDGYKAVRARCAELGVACPKPTSVLTLDEMEVTGIFRTPRGYAAMVNAVPIKLSYTIYPGEKFYDGQLVAVEDGKLTFRKITRMTDGKENVSAVDKPLKQQSINDLGQVRAETVSVPAGQISAAAVPQTAPESKNTVNASGMEQKKLGMSKPADDGGENAVSAEQTETPVKTRTKIKPKNKK
jgi:hypothetical protein